MRYVEVNKKILDYYPGCKEMIGIVGKIKRTEETFAWVEFPCYCFNHKHLIPIDCLDEIKSTRIYRDMVMVQCL
jgi:hypothetical protein